MTEETRRQPRRPMGGPMGGGMPTEKAKDFKGTFSKLITYSRSYLPVVIIAMIAAVFGAILQI
ncbi:MAG: hypothetical protein FWG19_04470, partial [Methanomassiliicoccaceae archaeon]|nr:hypothetical protein [Methanomassiliicoccaceae archaeon]